MQPQRFEHLQERLLRAGIGPRHVKRYLAELSDHFEDVVRAEEGRGLARAEAEDAAILRMGNDEDLAAGLLARPELRAFSARYPWAAYGLGSFIAFAAGFVAIGFATVLFLTIAATVAVRAQIAPDGPSWFVTALEIFRALTTHGLPLIVGAAIVLSAVRQRMPVLWPIIGLVIVSVLGAMTNFDVTLGPPGQNHFKIGLGFSNEAPALGQYAIHSLVNLMALLMLYAVAVKKLLGLGLKSGA